MGFGEYLVGKGLITKEQHELAQRIQNKYRLLGEIAVEMNYLSPEKVNEISDYIEGRPDVMFGEAAVSLGYLTSSQLKYLLDIRTRRKIRIGDIFVQHKFITEAVLHQEVMGYNAKRHKLKKILICDPSPTVSRILDRWLAKWSYTVLHAASGIDALETARKSKPDILMTSALLADMDGYTLCHNVLTDNQTVNIRTIIISSDVTPENIENAFESGVNHFLKKPVIESELINILFQLEREESEKKPEKILIVDDSPGARAVIQKELASTWSNIYKAENGLEAVEKAKQIKPDIITMDVEMPVMGGLEACQRLKENPATENIPVLIITASDTPMLRARGFEAGAVEYFTKPFTPGRLTGFLKMLVESRKIVKKEKILVADDSSVTRHIMRYFFKKNGYNVETAADGETALEILPKFRPDIIVTDCYMPKMGGFTLTAKIREMEEYRHVPIIMVTASSSKTDVLHGLAAGANDYITKPFDESELLARVGTHLKNKELYEQLRAEKEKLKAANAEKDKFLGIAAHDLRNPLSSIQGYAELLHDGNYDDALTKKFLKIITGATHGMLALLEDLLDISKIESGAIELQKQPWDISQMIQNRIDLAVVAATQKKITVTCSLTQGIIVEMDRHKMEQVIDNLLSNAIKFTLPDKSIHVMVENAGSIVKVSVRDEGIGIPPEEHHRLFKPFSRTTARPTGNEKSTGLGLAIASKIVHAHGGNMGVESAVDGGSIFYFTVPKASMNNGNLDGYTA